MSGFAAVGVSPRPRPMPLILGALVLAVAWAGPLPELASAVFPAHMTMHVLVVAVAPPLLVLGVAGSRWEPALAMRIAPLPAALVDLLTVWGWHTPLLHNAARGEPAVLALEQASFLAAGLLVWLSALGGDRRKNPARAAAGIIGLLVTSMHMTLLGALLTLSPRLLYGLAAAGTMHGSGLDDLHFGGMLMLLGGGLTYLIGALYLLGVLLSDDGRRSP